MLPIYGYIHNYIYIHIHIYMSLSIYSRRLLSNYLKVLGNFRLHFEKMQFYCSAASYDEKAFLLS